jgi:hypothetical protein
MDFLINETQLKIILTEQDKSKMNDYMKKLYSFTSDIIEKTKEQYGLNLKLLLTWGASVGGIVMPLDNFIRTGNFNLTDGQKTLVLVGVAASLFYDNSRTIKQIREKIKEEGIWETFEEILLKAKQLRKVFVKFLKSLNTTLGGSFDIIKYTFLIPIITDIQSIATNTKDIEKTAILISERLIASGVIIVTSIVLTEVINKIIKRLK